MFLRQVGRAASAQQEAGASQSEAEATWGQRPAKVSGSGLATSLRKFTACQRKYLALYLSLLAGGGNIDTLLAAHAGLAALPDARVMADLARRACLQLLLLHGTSVWLFA